MKYVSYQLSNHARRRMEARKIQEAWINAALTNPDRVDPDKLDESLTHVLKKIADMEDRVLRVVYNQTVDPPRIVSAHFDRRLRGKI